MFDMFWRWFDRVTGIEHMRHARQMNQFREAMAFFGHSLDHLTDDEIIERLQEVTPTFAAAGISSVEAKDAFTAFARELYK